MAIYELGRNGLNRIDVSANHGKNNLPMGTVLHWGGNMGFPAQDYAIIRKSIGGFSGETFYDCVSLANFRPHRVESFSIKAGTDDVWHGQHFFLTDRVLSGDELLELVEKSRATVKGDAEAKEAKEQARLKELARLRALDNGLVKLDENNKNALVTACKNIRIELKRAFPGVKFSVKSERYSGGDNISVGWTDGPTTEQVDKIVDKYSGGSFDGMTDSYDYSDAVWIDVYGDAKYIHTSRSYSEAVSLSCKIDVCIMMGIKYEGENTKVPEDWRHRYDSTHSMVWRTLANVDLCKGYNGITAENL